MKFRAKLISMQKFVLIISAAFFLQAGAASAQTSSLFELRGSVSGGTSFQDLRSESYDAKLLPTVGGSLSVFFKREKPLSWGIELSYDHNFRSDDKNFYYYSSYEKIGFTPTVEFSFPGRGPQLYAFGGLGINFAFSGYMNKAFIASRLGTGILFKNSFFHGILVSYSHGFLSDYKAFETLRAGVVFRLLEKEMR